MIFMVMPTMNLEIKEDSETKSEISWGECVRCICTGFYTFYLMVAETALVAEHILMVILPVSVSPTVSLQLEIPPPLHAPGFWGSRELLKSKGGFISIRAYNVRHDIRCFPVFAPPRNS